MRSCEKLGKRAAISPAAACRLCILAYEFESEVLRPTPQFVLLVLRGLLAGAYPQVEHRAPHGNSSRRCSIVASVLPVRLGASPLPSDRRCQSGAAISLPLRGVIRGYFGAFCGDSFVRSRCGKPEEILPTSPWWPQRDSNPCFSLERATTSLVLTEPYAAVAIWRCHFRPLPLPLPAGSHP